MGVGARHQWSVEYTYGKARAKVMTSEEIYSKQRAIREHYGDKSCIRIYVTEALQTGNAELPVDSYTFGFWLGDGVSDQPYISIFDEDRDEVLAAILYQHTAFYPKKPLSYKPNSVTESIMVYRRNCNFLVDENMKSYREYDRHENEAIDTTNCWHIAPKHDGKHPAVFPEELCHRVLKYYSFEGDTVLYPLADSGTTGRVAERMKRIPILCEIKEDYIKRIREEVYL